MVPRCRTLVKIHGRGQATMKNVVALSASLLLVLLLSPSPAQAQATTMGAPPTVVDRTAITLTYLPLSAGPPATSATSFALSWRFDRTWDLLLSSSTVTGTGAGTATRYGVRYHLRAPGPAWDPYVTIQAASETGAQSPFLVGAGFSYDVAPTVTTYTVLTYHSQDQFIYYDIGVQYQLNRQFSFVGGVNSGAGYLGLSFNLAAR